MPSMTAMIAGAVPSSARVAEGTGGTHGNVVKFLVFTIS